jgi:AcrR family transcriptional regulator
MAGSRRDGVKRRDEILDAALLCFSSRGIFETGIEEIRKAAGANPSSMYHLFGDLSTITLALLLRTFERLFSHLTTKVCAMHTAKSAVLALVDSHLEWILSHPEEGRFMYQAMSMELGTQVNEPLQQKKAELLAPLEAHLLPFMVEGSLPNWSPVMLDIVLLGVSHEACRRYLGGAAIDPTWMRAQLPLLAWKSIVLM